MYRSMPVGARRSRLMLAANAVTVVSMLSIRMSSVPRPFEWLALIEVGALLERAMPARVASIRAAAEGPDLATVGSALILVFALAAYATVAAVLAARRRDRRLMRSASNAVLAAFAGCLLARRLPAGAAGPPRLLDRRGRRAHQPPAAAALHADRAVGQPARIAAAVADGAQRRRRAGHAPEPPPQPRADAVGGGRAGLPDDRLRGHGGVHLAAVREGGGGGAGRRLRARPLASEPVHDGAPAHAVHGLRARWRCRSRSPWRR